MPGPWDTYANASHPATLFRVPGTGPKAPTGYRSTDDGNLAAIAGGPDDIAVAARRAGAEASARAAVERGLIAARAASEISTHQQLQNIDSSGSALDPSTITYYAQQVLAGAPMPAIGMGKQAAAARQEIMREVARLGGAAGLTGADQARQLAHYKAGSAQVANLEKMAGTIGVNEQTALANGQQFLDRSRELPGQTGIAPLNALSNAVQRAFGGTTISAADAAYNTFVNEYAKVVSGSPSGAGTLSDSARHEAMDTIRGNASYAQKQAAFAQMKADMANRMTAIHGGISEAYKGLTTQPGFSVPDSTAGLIAPGLKSNNGSIGLPGAGGPSSGGGGQGPTGGNTPPTLSLATGTSRTEADPKASALINSLVRSGASEDQVNAAMSAMGIPNVEPGSVAKAQEYLRKNPSYKGSFGDATRQVDNGILTRAASSPFGAAVAGAADAATLGTLDNLTSDPAATRAKMAALSSANPYFSLAGNVVGGVAAAGGLEAGLGALGARLGGAGARILSNPLTNDLVYGAGYGAGSDDENRLGGSVTGAIGGAAGGMFGRGVVRGARALRGPVVDAAGAASGPILTSVQKAGLNTVQNSLAEAAQLGLPMSLADTATNLRSLGGAAVRRSPNAAQIAEDALLPRSRGQYDRFTSAVNRDLGPTANIPQTSIDIMNGAQAAASPLYDAAYAAPAIGSPELDSLLQTPAGRSALSRAHTIAANERRDPKALGFALDGQGNVTLNPVRDDLFSRHAQAQDAFTQAQDAHRAALRTPGVDADATRDALTSARANLRDATDALASAPSSGTAATSRQYSPQTLDYVKRGIDDVIGSLPKTLSGKPIMDEHYRAVDGVRRQLLSELDTLNPAYGQARAAYAGPASSKEAMVRGGDLYGETPDAIGVAVQGQSPEHLAQMQLGYRGAMMDRAGKVRDASNPWEAVLGSPSARGGVDAMYPGNAGTANLFRQRDLEGQLARTTNDILGNSKTAERQIADRTFAGSPLPALALDAGTMALGGVPTASIARSLGGNGVRDAFALGLGKRAVAKADALAPALFDVDPRANLDLLARLGAQADARGAYVNNPTALRIGGMFGRGLGSSGAGYLAGF